MLLTFILSSPTNILKSPAAVYAESVIITTHNNYSLIDYDMYTYI